MIHTTFRVAVKTTEADRDLFDTMTLCSVFKSASSAQETVPDFGIAKLDGTDEGVALTSDALIATGKKIDDAVSDISDLAAKAKEVGQKIGIFNKQGRLITPEAMDAYRETFVMRKSFAIRNTERTNIDKSSKKLPKILPEDINRYFPTPSAEQLAKAMTAKPRTKKEQMEDTLSRYPQVVPALGLRVSLLHHPIWDRNDEVARNNWKKALRPQLHEQLEELQKDLLRLEVPNNVNPLVKDVLQFNRLDLRFDEMTLSVANEDINRLGEVEETLDTFYDHLNNGAFGDKEIIRVDAPFINYDLLQLENEGKKARYEEELAAAEEAARLQAEREAQWELEAQQSEALIEAGRNAAAAAGSDGLVQETSEPVNDAEFIDLDEDASELDALETTDEDEATDAEATEPELEDEGEKEIDHYMGRDALLFSRRTTYESRMSARELARRKAEAAEEKARLLAEAQEQGISLMPELGDRVWGIIYADGSIAYFDSVQGTFCEMPEPEPVEESEETTLEATDETISTFDEDSDLEEEPLTALSA